MTAFMSVPEQLHLRRKLGEKYRVEFNGGRKAWCRPSNVVQGEVGYEDDVLARNADTGQWETSYYRVEGIGKVIARTCRTTQNPVSASSEWVWAVGRVDERAVGTFSP